MKEDGHTPITISGFISMSLDLNGTISAEDLRAKKFTFDPYQMLLDDLIYRLEMGEGLNSEEFDKYPEDTAFVEWLIKYLGNMIESDQLPIEKVQFYEYEENGSVQGYDYIATLKLGWEDLWNKWNKYNQI